MSSLQQLKQRIKSVKNTSQLTKAMQMVAAIRFKKNLQIANSADLYERSLSKTINYLASSAISLSSPFFVSRPKNKSIMLIIGPTRGFCAGLGRSITVSAYSFLKEKGDIPTDSNQINFITVNRPAFREVSRLGGKVLANFEQLSKNNAIYNTLAISELVYQIYKEDNSISTVYISYAKNGVVQTEQIIPFITENKSPSFPNIDTTTDIVLNEFNHQYLHAQIHSAIMQTMSSEEKARMVAMNQATENAKKIAGKLQLEFFRQRQAKITQEMNEISSNL